MCEWIHSQQHAPSMLALAARVLAPLLPWPRVVQGKSRRLAAVQPRHPLWEVLGPVHMGRRFPSRLDGQEHMRLLPPRQYVLAAGLHRVIVRV